MSDAKDKQCNIYNQYRQVNSGFFGTNLNGYDGIPQNLVLNFTGWAIMMLLFSVLRKKAWNYGRLALVQRWTEMLFGGGSSSEGDTQVPESEIPRQDVNSLVKSTGLVNGDVRIHEADHQEPSPATSATAQLLKPNDISNGSPGSGNISNNDFSRIMHSDSKVILDTGYFSWIKIVFTLTDNQYLEKCGFDCVQYLSFQRHLIFLASIVTLASLVIVLPINYQGTPLSDNTTQFNQTTIINLKHDPKLLWVHVILAIAFLFLSIAVMRHFSRALKFVEDDPAIRRSIMVIGISRKFCNEEKLKLHFQEIYPDVELAEVTFAYDISELQKVEFSRQTAQMATIYWEDFLAKHGRRPMMSPHYCGAICWSNSICGCDSRDALEFYTQEEEHYTREVVTERERALTKPLGIAFITFKSVDMAERVVNDYRLLYKILGQTPESKFSRKLKSPRWTVKFAPLPEDLYWENLTTGLKTWYLKVLLVNIALLSLVTIFTTPVYLLQKVDQFSGVTKLFQNGTQKSSTLQGLLLNTFPTLLLFIMAVTLPSLVSVSDKFVGFWTKTAENRSRMIKVFSFLIFMVVILPSLGMTSVFLWFSNDEESSLNWNCIFSKDNGALFVNYICTSTFLGTASELMRLPELLVYCVKLCFARSTAEIASIRQSVLWDFQIGSQYAWMMLNFAIFSVFSVIFPVVTPFGLVYLIMKHFVDRYNIYFAYGPTKVEKEVHGTAINFVIVCMFILQTNLLAYVLTQGRGDGESAGEEAKGLKVFCVVGFCITTALFISQIFFNMCANFSPILYRRMSREGGLNLNYVGNSGDSNPNATTASQGNVGHVVPQINFHNGTPGDLYSQSNRDEISVASASFHSKRKYIPRILTSSKPRPPAQAGLVGSPTASVNSVSSAGPGTRSPRINKKTNKHQIVTAVIINKESGAPEERYINSASTNSTV